jgi:hypothetical protein
VSAQKLAVLRRGRVKRAPLRALGPKLSFIDARSAKPDPKGVDRFYLTPEWRALVAEKTGSGATAILAATAALPPNTVTRAHQSGETWNGSAVLEAGLADRVSGVPRPRPECLERQALHSRRALIKKTRVNVRRLTRRLMLAQGWVKDSPPCGTRFLKFRQPSDAQDLSGNLWGTALALLPTASSGPSKSLADGLLRPEEMHARSAHASLDLFEVKSAASKNLERSGTKPATMLFSSRSNVIRPYYCGPTLFFRRIT